MIAYHGKEEIKQLYVNRVLAHQKADEIIKDIYWEDGKGCAVGCTLHSSDHNAYEIELGVPEWLAHVEDKLFEGMSIERSKLFPTQFLEAINVGSDLDKIKAPFLIFVLQSALENFDHEKFPDCKKAIDRVIELYQSGETDLEKFRDASNAAAYAAYAASAAYASSNAATYAASASNAATYAANAANAATYAAYAATYAADVAAYEKFADKLLELIRDCK